MASIPLQELQRRITGLQHEMKGAGLDASLIVQRVDLYYYSGTGQDGHLLVPAEGPAVLMVRKSYERAREESPLDTVIPVKSLSDVKNEVHSALGSDPGRLGMELDVLPFNNYRAYVRMFPHARIEDISPAIRKGRAVKSEFELGKMEQAAIMNAEVFGMAKDLLREGMPEVEFSALLELEYRKRGHQGFVRVRGFNSDVFYGHVMSGVNLTVPSCAVGPTGGPGLNASFPQGAGMKAIKRHEPVQVDYVGIVDGYMVDQARTFFVGEPPEEFLRVHSVAVEIQQAIVNKGRTGVRAEELYETALGMAADAGLSDGFMGYPQPVPFVAHGVGLELDELPIVGKRSPHVLETGMVIALEPKFILPGKGLAGIENCYVVGETGLERLTLLDDAILSFP